MPSFRRHSSVKLYWIIASLLSVNTVAFCASFYGSSYVSLALEDSRSTTKISFRLKTSRSDAMLLLSAGPIDYCLITLDNGSLKLRINLGSGEVVLMSKNGLKLNDLIWHQVEIDRSDGELTMTIDGLHSTYLDIPGKFFELNVKYGLFVGSLGDFNELFLGNLRDFRGCIDSLLFNEIDVFESVSKSADGVIESVTFDCSNEFDATSNDPISFIDPGAFIILPGFENSRSGATLRFRVKTSSEMAILFYNSGSPTQLADFIAVEIINGRISLSANDGNGVVVLQSDVIVNDGVWHEVEIRFTPSYLEVNVDGKSRNLRPSLGDKKFFDLSESLYVGGLELNKQSFAFQQGLQTILSEGTEISLKGCLKDIKINEELLGIPEADVSKGIKAGDCLWQFADLTESPCAKRADCNQEGLNMTDVIPLMNPSKSQYLTVTLHQKVLITTDHLDATTLAQRTKSNPKYVVTKKARFGVLKKFVDQKVNKSRRRRDVATNWTKETLEFTHEDVVEGRIAFVVKSDVNLKSSGDFLTDEINFDLFAPDTQPENVVLKIKIVKTSNNAFETTEPSTSAQPTKIQTIGSSNESTSKPAEIDSEMIRPNINYLNIIITRDHLVIIAVASFILLAVVIILIVMRASSRSSYQESMDKGNKQESIRTFGPESTAGSEYDGDAILMNNHRHISMHGTSSISEMETCIPPPPTSLSVSTNCGSITDHRSRSATPLKTYQMPVLANRYRVIGTESDPRVDTVFPLPPPSLYFGTESACDSTTPSSQWCTFHPNTLPSSKLSPSSSNYSHDHNTCNHSLHHLNGTEPSPMRIMGDGTSNVGTPLPSLRKLPWSSEDISQSTYNDQLPTDHCCHSPINCPTTTTPKGFYVNGNEPSRIHSFTTPTTPMVRKRQHYWI